MPAITIKNTMNGMERLATTAINSCDASMSALNSVDGNSVPTLLSSLERLVSCVVQVDRDIQYLYSMTSAELEILFKDYNSFLSSFSRYGDEMMDSIYSIIASALKLQLLTQLSAYVSKLENMTLDINTSGVESELKSKRSDISRYKSHVETLKQRTMQNNKKIIIKESNYK